MSWIFVLYRTINRLSLDIAVGAAICSIFFAQIFGIHLRPLPVVLLLFSVWIIYAGDHLLDAKRINIQQLSERRRYFLSHFKPILIAFVVVLALTAAMSFFLYLKVIFGGLTLSALVLLYFIIKDFLPGIKEFFSAALYSGGVLLAPLLNMKCSMSPWGVLIILQFILTVILNLLLFSLLDYKNDIHERQMSVARYFGKAGTIKLILTVTLLQYILLAFSILTYREHIFEAIIILTMNIVLTFLYFFRERFTQSEIFRAIGDSIFFLPLVYILIR